MPTDEFTQHVSELLPDAVKHPSPGVEVPAGGIIDAISSFAKDKVGDWTQGVVPKPVGQVMTAHFEIKNAGTGRYVFNLKAANGEIILTSGMHPTKDAASAAITETQVSAASDPLYERKIGKDDKPYFVLKSAVGQVLGRSEMYSSNRSLENGIASVMRNAPTATIKDLTEVETEATHA